MTTVCLLQDHSNLTFISDLYHYVKQSQTDLYGDSSKVNIN